MDGKGNESVQPTPAAKPPERKTSAEKNAIPTVPTGQSGDQRPLPPGCSHSTFLSLEKIFSGARTAVGISAAFVGISAAFVV